MQPRKSAFLAAFPHTIPVMTGFLCLGMAFGILLSSRGYGVLWALLMSGGIYAGSMQFAAVGLLAGGFAPLTAFLLTLMVNARHLFYGIAMLARFKGFGRAKPYMIFSLTDETFSLLAAVEPPPEVDPKRFSLAIALLDHLYWVVGSVMGSLLGSAIAFETRGIEFVMTALFVVIFLSQWQTKKGRVPALLGVGMAALCLLVFGRDWFLPPTMLALVLLLTVFRRTLGREVDLS